MAAWPDRTLRIIRTPDTPSPEVCRQRMEAEWRARWTEAGWAAAMAHERVVEARWLRRHCRRSEDRA